MKTQPLLRKIVGIGMMSIFTFGFANTMIFAQDAKVNCTVLPSSEGKKLVVSFKNVAQDELTYSIRDHYGYVYTEEKIADAKHYAKVLNLNDLAEGEYIFSYQFNGFEKSTILTLSDSKVEVSDASKLQSFFTPVHWKQNGNKLKLFVDNESQEPLNVSILDSKGQQVFKMYYNEKGDYLKRLDLAKLDEGNYTLIFTKGETNIIDQIVVK